MLHSIVVHSPDDDVFHWIYDDNRVPVHAGKPFIALDMGQHRGRCVLTMHPYLWAPQTSSLAWPHYHVLYVEGRHKLLAAILGTPSPSAGQTHPLTAALLALGLPAKMWCRV